MYLVENKDHIIQNLENLEYYLTEGDEIQMNQANQLIKRGTCFIAYQIDNELRFSPSRFVGYYDNTIEKHQRSTTKHGGITNSAISKILHSNPLNDDQLDSEYIKYCHKLGIRPSEKGSFGVKRKFWKFHLKNDFQNNITLGDEFPEGRIVERKHIARERNKKLIAEVKVNFRSKYGDLYCQVCEFNFENVYGEIGQNFIECHHTLPVSEMPDGHKTKVEDMAVLCSNCHKMIHRKRPWLRVEDLKKLINSGGR